MSTSIARPDAGAQISAMLFAVLLLDPDGRVAQVNQAMEDISGRSEGKLLGERLDALVKSDDARISELLMGADNKLVARAAPIRLCDKAMVANITASPLLNHSGWRIVTVSDIGQGDANEDGQLRAPAVLAHEIKNPLSAIRGAGQLLAKKLDKNDRSLTRMITREVDRIARLIDRMQALGRERPEPVEPINVHEAIRAAIATIRAGTADGVELVEEFDPSLPPVIANRDTLGQVLINLLANACEACAGNTEPRVGVRTRFVGGTSFSKSRSGKAVRLPVEVSVSDNGPGVSPELREHLFKPFATSKQNGQGLGLALVRKLLDDMGGCVSYERDEAGELTYFHVSLPVAEAL